MNEIAINTEKTSVRASENGDLLNKAQVAERLNISMRTLETWMAAGDIPFWRRKKLVRFHWQDVEAHLRRRFGVGYSPGITSR